MFRGYAGGVLDGRALPGKALRRLAEPTGTQVVIGLDHRLQRILVGPAAIVGVGVQALQAEQTKLLQSLKPEWLK